MMRVNEYVQVGTSTSGAPLHFVWRGVTYQVIARPEPWLSRRPWWIEHKQQQRVHNSIDLRMWRIEALPLNHARDVTEATCDLCYEATLNSWTLVNIWSDEYDQQLFP